MSWQPHALHSRGIWNPFASQEAVFSQQDWSSTEWQGADPAPCAICSLFIFLHLSITSQINGLQSGRAGGISRHTGGKPSPGGCQLPHCSPSLGCAQLRHAACHAWGHVLSCTLAGQHRKARQLPHVPVPQQYPLLSAVPPTAHVHTHAHACTPAPYARRCSQACHAPPCSPVELEAQGSPRSSPSAGGHVWWLHLSTQPLPSVLLPVSAGAGGPGLHPAGCTGAAFPLPPSSSQRSTPLCRRLCPPGDRPLLHWLQAPACSLHLVLRVCLSPALFKGPFAEDESWSVPQRVGGGGGLMVHSSVRGCGHGAGKGNVLVSMRKPKAAPSSTVPWLGPCPPAV